MIIKRHEKTMIGLLFVILIGGLLWLNTRSSDKEVALPTWGEVEITAEDLDLGDDQVASVSLAESTDKYSDWRSVNLEEYGASFLIPPDFTVGNFPDGEGEVFVIQNAEKLQGFQVRIMPHDESGPLTAERIRQDLPSLEMRQVEEVLLEGQPAGVAFLSDSEVFGGNSREVWLVKDGRLFQISTYKSLEPLLLRVFSTWEFK